MITTKYLSNETVASKEFGYDDESSRGMGVVDFCVTTKELTHEDGSTEVVSQYTKVDNRSQVFYQKSTNYTTEKGFRAAIKRIGAK
tara:strand:- start:345 stop:602 length:258 start_codon:yes stop_codon:yes gene_type:complete